MTNPLTSDSIDSPDGASRKIETLPSQSLLSLYVPNAEYSFETMDSDKGSQYNHVLAGTSAGDWCFAPFTCQETSLSGAFLSAKIGYTASKSLICEAQKSHRNFLFLPQKPCIYRLFSINTSLNILFANFQSPIKGWISSAVSKSSLFRLLKPLISICS